MVELQFILQNSFRHRNETQKHQPVRIVKLASEKSGGVNIQSLFG